MTQSAAALGSIFEQPGAPPSDFEQVILSFAKEANRPLSLALLRSVLAEDRHVATGEDIDRIAYVAGFDIERLQKSAFDLEPEDLPTLVESENGEFAIIVAFEDDQSFTAIEAKGIRQGLKLEEQTYTHDAKQLIKLDFSRKSFGDRWRWLIKPVKENRWAYSQVLIAALVINFLALSTSIFTMVVYDRVLPNNATESLIALTIGVSIALVFDLILKMLRGWFLDGAGGRADIRIGEKLFEQLLSMDLSTKRDSVGGLSSVMREFESLRDFLASATLIAIIDVPFIVIFLLVIFFIGGPIVLIPAILVPLVILAGVLAQPFLNRLANETLEEGKNKQSILVETISGLEVVKTSSASKEMRKRWRDSLIRQAASSIKTRVVSQLVINFSAFAQQAAQVGIIVLGASQVSAGNLTLGGLIASVILAGRTMAPLAQIANVLTRIVQAKTSFKALDSFMGLPTDRPPQAQFLQKNRFDGQVEFRQVNFSYPDAPRMTLKELTFSIEPGEKVAILGKIGSGKSTLARLMLGLYSPNTGSVMIDRTDVRQLDPFDLRRNISFVMQDSWLFSGTVRENIASGMEGATDEDIVRAATIAGVHDFLADHPKGYDLMLRERGEGLSGGQRQAISIARGLVNPAPILVLDEPTSMMDMNAEQKFVDRLHESLRDDQTVIVITHRNAMLKLVDRVIVIDQGTLVADGPKSILNKPKAS